MFAERAAKAPTKAIALSPATLAAMSRVFARGAAARVAFEGARWAVAAAVHLGFGSPTGIPDSGRVEDAVSDLGFDVSGLAPVHPQVLGVARFTGTLERIEIDADPEGKHRDPEGVAVATARSESARQ